VLPVETGVGVQDGRICKVPGEEATAIGRYRVSWVGG
jgi:hypothetical protein